MYCCLLLLFFEISITKQILRALTARPIWWLWVVSKFTGRKRKKAGRCQPNLSKIITHYSDLYGNYLYFFVLIYVIAS